MIHIYYGDGKGKTSILNGSAIRAKGAGLSVGYFRFLKGIESSENTLLKKSNIDFFEFHYGNKFIFQMNNEELAKTQELVNYGINQLISTASNYDVILIDEFLDLIETNLKTEDELIGIIKKINSKEVLISGHKKYPNLFKLANLITYLKKEKHYYDQKASARKGIEY